MGVRLKVATLVDHVVSDVAVPFNVLEEELQEVWTDEELEVRL
jgi:hypothetical protein